MKYNYNNRKINDKPQVYEMSSFCSSQIQLEMQKLYLIKFA